MISPELVERVRESADIVQIIGEHVKLRRAGADFRGPCPFHGGKNPNFSVSPRRGIYHCFKCQESGNVFTFLQKQLGMSFPDAVRSVAATVGIDIPEFTEERAGPDPREPFWEVNATAAEYFRALLWDDPIGAAARSYLDQRGISHESANKYSLGVAPREIGLLRAHMATLGFDEQRLLESGLLVKPDDNSEPRPRFRNRLIFPILDASGRYVGFGGRTLGDAEPKYLNSPETPVFSKGKTLYALNWTRNDIRKEDRAFVVEGYFDAIRLMESGLNTVVAPLGTALTGDQATLLGKYTKNIYLLYDSDPAGLKATFRTGDELLRQRMSVRVVTLPNGEDPDTYVRTHGAQGLEVQVSQAIDIFERKLQLLDRGGWFNELQKKRRALDRLLPTIRATKDPLLCELYITRAAEKTGIAKDVLLREVGARTGVGDGEDGTTAPYQKGGGRAQRSGTSTLHSDAYVRPRTSPSRYPDYNIQGHAAERELIRAMLSDPDRIEPIAEKVGPSRFRDPHFRSIFVAMLALGDAYDIERLTDHLTPDAIEIINTLQSESGAQINPEETVSASISSLLMRDDNERLASIDREITVASDSEKIELVNEKMRIIKEIELSGQPMAKGFKFLKQHRGRAR
jgi:DNA primase